MAFEVADVAIVVGREITDAMVDFGGGIDDGIGVVGEAGQGAAILLRLQLFCVGAFFCVIELECVIGASEKNQGAGSVEVKGCVVQARSFEELQETMRSVPVGKWLRRGRRMG